MKDFLSRYILVKNLDKKYSSWKISFSSMLKDFREIDIFQESYL